MNIDLSNISSTMVWVILMAFLAGVVEFGKNVWDGLFGDWTERPAKRRTAFIIAFAVLAGFFVIPTFGSFFGNLTASQLRIVGVLAGFATSGAVTIAFNWGKSGGSSPSA